MATRMPNDPLATILVTEDKEIITENAIESNPASPLVAQISGLEHTFILRKEDGKWKIISDQYNDFLWRTMRRRGKSAEQILNRLNTIETPTFSERNIENVGTETVFALPYDSSSHTYNRVDAANYAKNHALTVDYNLNYASYDDGEHGDCTNFVSQALYEGGNISMDISPSLPAPDVGGFRWYYLNNLQRAAAWTDVDSFYNFVTASYDVWTEGPDGYELGPVPEGQWPFGLMVGDVIQYNEEIDSAWEHSAIVVGFDQSGDPLVASHSPNTPEIHFMDVVYHQKTRFIHIERSDGYPPIRMETTSSADDAGGNPGGICPITNPDPPNNYLGGCFNGGQGVVSGFLFRNIQIPKGAQIKYAFVSFTTDGTYTVRTQDPGVYAPISLLIRGENTATPSDFSPSYTPAQRQNLTDPPVYWPINRTDSNENISYDTWHWKEKRTTPDISYIIGSITGLYDWVPGSTISIIFENGEPYATTYARRVIAFEGVPENYYSARLITAYDVNTNSLSFNSVADNDGYILEFSENSEKGRYTGSNAIIVGDESDDRQYRGILHFNT